MKPDSVSATSSATDMTDAEIRNTAIEALNWAKGSWGERTFGKAPYDDETMAKIWQQIADIAKERADKFDCK